MDIINASCSGETKQSLMQCFHTIEAINFTVSNVRKSKAHLLQLMNDIQQVIATLQLISPYPMEAGHLWMLGTPKIFFAS